MAGVLVQDSSDKKRKNVDYNAHELIIALCLNDPSIETKEQCLCVSYQSVCEKIKGCSEEQFKRYKEDIDCRSPRIIKLYISHFKKDILLTPFYTNEITAIYLEGKTITSSKILELNVDINHKYAKADIYVEFATKEIFGLSIKQTKNCTKGNYSVEKMVDECLTTDDKGNLCKIRKKVLRNAGFETHIKEQRKQVNKLFYPKETNDYWVQVKHYLTVYNEPIKKKLIEYLYPIQLPYVLYEFDGKELKELKIDTNDAVLQEHVEYYYTKKKKLLRNAAKLFYQLKVNNQIYRVEIRWKGNIHSSSPQFQLHLVDE